MSDSFTYTVYALLFPGSHEAYVGSTMDLKNRLIQHRHGTPAIAERVKAGIEPVVRVLEEGPQDTMHGKERRAFLAIHGRGYKMLNRKVPTHRLMVVHPDDRREQPPVKTIGLRVETSLIAQVDRFAKQESQSRSWAIRELIDRSLRRLRMPADEGTRKAS